jgi:DNA polymerase IV
VLNKEGIFKVADLQVFPLDELISKHGAWGYHYYFAARGEDNRAVHWEESAPKSIGAETTFERDQTDLAFLAEELKRLAQKSHRRLRAHKMRVKRISLKLRYSSFKTITRSLTLPYHANELELIQQKALELFSFHYHGSPPLRLIGISFEQLSDSYWQPIFF